MLLTTPNAYAPPMFSYADIHNEEKFEVLFTLRNKPRRIAVCANEKDARIIVKALEEYTERGGNWV